MSKVANWVGIASAVYESYYRVCLRYFKLTNAAHEYYDNAMLYLAYLSPGTAELCFLCHR